MKNIYSQKAGAFIFFYSLFLFSFNGLAQVGINTTEPRTELEVAGDGNIQGKILVNVINSIQNGEEGHLLAQTQDNFIKEMDMAEEGVALAYFQEYVLTNMDGDWIANFNTKVEASKYGMIVISAFFDLEIELSDPSSNFTIPYAFAFVEGGTWRLLADYPSGNKRDETKTGTWTITTLIITKSISKDLGTKIIKMGGNTSGAAATPIID